MLYFSSASQNFFDDYLDKQKDKEKIFDLFLKKINSLTNKIYINELSSNALNHFLKKKINLTVLKNDSEISLMNQIWKKDNSDIAFVEHFSPLLDLEIIQQLYNIHRTHMAEFSFVENLPLGMGVEFFSANFLQTFLYNNNASESDLSAFFYISAYAKKNIQKFHTEIHFVDQDLRPYRLQLILNNKRNYHLVSSLVMRQNDLSLIELENFLLTQPQILATKPAYLEIELTSDCDYTCSFCPRSWQKPEKREMSVSLLENRLQEYFQNSFDDTVLALGGLGEPTQHPQFVSLIKNILATSQNNVYFIVIETNGLYLELFQHFTSQELSKLKTIVNINSIENYLNMHGRDNFKKIYQNIEFLQKLYSSFDLPSKEHIWLQVLKIEENEKELDALYDLAEQLNTSFLLQKYNRFAFMPEKRVSDMTPLERTFCWHLARDLYIRADGHVTFCKQDFAGNCLSDSLQEKSIEEIFQSRSQYFKKNFLGDYTFCHCHDCDEYFTFNH